MLQVEIAARDRYGNAFTSGDPGFVVLSSLTDYAVAGSVSRTVAADTTLYQFRLQQAGLYVLRVEDAGGRSLHTLGCFNCSSSCHAEHLDAYRKALQVACCTNRSCRSTQEVSRITTACTLILLTPRQEPPCRRTSNSVMHMATSLETLPVLVALHCLR